MAFLSLSLSVLLVDRASYVISWVFKSSLTQFHLVVVVFFFGNNTQQMRAALPYLESGRLQEGGTRIF